MNGTLTDPAGQAPAKVALAPFLVSCPAVVTLGLKPTLAEYGEEGLALLRSAEKVYFPTRRYLDLFEAAGVPVFPSAASYRYPASPAMQQRLFRYLDWPSAPARVYFGERQKRRIERDFQLPLEVVLDPEGRAAVLRVTTREALEALVRGHRPVLVRSLRAWRRRLRCLIVAGGVLGWQRSTPAEGWQPLRQSDGEPVRDLAERSLELARAANLDDVLLDWGQEESDWLCLGMNRPRRWFATAFGRLDRHRWIARQIEEGRL